MLPVAGGIGGRGGLSSHYGVLTIRRIIGSLRLFAGRKLILARRHGRPIPNAMPPAERRQRGIRQLRAAFAQLLMDPHEIPLAAVE